MNPGGWSFSAGLGLCFLAVLFSPLPAEAADRRVLASGVHPLNNICSSKSVRVGVQLALVVMDDSSVAAAPEMEGYLLGCYATTPVCWLALRLLVAGCYPPSSIPALPGPP